MLQKDRIVRKKVHSISNRQSSKLTAPAAVESRENWSFLQTFIIEGTRDLPNAAKHLLPLIEGYSTVALSGDLGSGKTSLVKAICTLLDVVDDVSSPTFSLINSYLTKDGSYIHHMDLYRLKSIEEALDIGIEEYLDQEELIFIEWPELIRDILPDDTLHLSLEHMDKERRKIVIL